jgi:hypothetical protein
LNEDRTHDLDTLMASLRADMNDAHAFLQALAARLDGAMPGQVEVQRGGGLFAKKAVKRVELQLGDFHFRITDAGHGRLTAERVRVVRGVALRTEQVSVDEWLAGVVAELRTQAESSSRGREALERLLLG